MSRNCLGCLELLYCGTIEIFFFQCTLIPNYFCQNIKSVSYIVIVRRCILYHYNIAVNLLTDNKMKSFLLFINELYCITYLQLDYWNDINMSLYFYMRYRVLAVITFHLSRVPDMLVSALSSKNRYIANIK